MSTGPADVERQEAALLLDLEAVKAAEWEHILGGRREAGIFLDGICSENGVGLALSGGGIRSATFCLGVIQGIAAAGYLKRIDYLSTVSGGGFIGAWLSAWIHREGLDHVDQNLRRQPSAGGSGEPEPVAWLRRYSNYLAPKLGILSGDSITLVTTWVRNVLLNLVTVVAFLALVFLLPRVLVEPTLTALNELHRPVGYAAAWLAFFIFPIAISLNLSAPLSMDRKGQILLMNGTWGVIIAVILPGMLTAWLGSAALFSEKNFFRTQTFEFVKGAAVMLGAAGTPWLIYQRVFGKHSYCRIFKEGAVFALAYAGALAVGVGLIAFFADVVQPVWGVQVEKAANVLTFGPPALLVTFGVVGSVIVGLARTYEERSREWWSRMNAWFLILGTTWLVVFALAFYAAPVASWAAANLGGWVAALAGAGWLGSLLVALLGPKPRESERTVSRFGRVGLTVALSIVVAGMLFAVAAGVGLTLERWAWPNAGASGSGFDEHLLHSFVAQQHLVTGSGAGPDITWVALGLCAGVLLLFGLMVDVNRFSLHALYKNRLVRCYLGASHEAQRRPHPFTGFDEEDDLPFHVMRGVGPLAEPSHSGTQKDTRPPARPLHIVNAAINITQGRNLAWQERKAASFTFSPLHCGFTLGAGTGDAAAQSLLWAGLANTGGYRSTKAWAAEGEERGGITLGTVAATSGAAASAVSGKSTLPALAFVATVFNARLGRWSPNPLQSHWRKSGPVAGLYYLLSELFGYATESTRFVHLSDGGHFDNTGVYELVRRQCKFIIAVDATADAGRGMEDLANLVRKCRIDFGTRISFAVENLGGDKEAQARSKGFVFGTIDYGNGREPGKLVVMKPTLFALPRLSVDLFSYARERASFPHQTTVDQFFSESQFESYRELGLQIALSCLDDPRFARAVPL